jgi:transcriptional regulator with XRE-family HTH domain
VLIGDRIRAIREAKKLSQGDIEERCGLLRVHLSRVENGHTIPSVETLEKLARALEVPLYQLFYEGEERPLLLHLPKRKLTAEIMWGTTRKEMYFWEKLRGLLARMSESDRRILLYMAQKMAWTPNEER